MRYDLVNVERFPKVFDPGKFYWSQEFEMSAHQCACGCGDVIQLPVDSLNFRIVQGARGFTLRPSVGNWGVCDSHYFITNSAVEWLPKLSPAEIAAGRKLEDDRREAHYSRKLTWRQRLWKWLGDRFKKIFG